MNANNNALHDKQVQLIENINKNTLLSAIYIEKNALLCKSYPTHVLIDTGNICNQYCKFCSSMVTDKNNKKIILSEGDFEGFDWLQYVQRITFSGNHGDVLANKNFPNIFRKVFSYAPKAAYGVYTNGAGLKDENLYIIAKYFKNVHISCNAISKESYSKVIAGGSFDNLMKNISNFATRKRNDVLFQISYVLTKENASDVTKLIDFCHQNNIDSLILHLAYYSHIIKNNAQSLKEESFLPDYSSYFNLDELNEEAKLKNVKFLYRTQEGIYHQGKCTLPWQNAYLAILQGKPAFYICCGGCRPILNAKKFNDFRNIMSFWNHERMQTIRRDANNPAVQSGMCAYCKKANTPIIQTKEHIEKVMSTYGAKSYDGEIRFFENLIVS